MIDTGQMRRRFWKFPPDDYEYDPRFMKLMNEMLRHSLQHNLEKIIVYGDLLETGTFPPKPTTPGDADASAGGHDADQKRAKG